MSEEKFEIEAAAVEYNGYIFFIQPFLNALFTLDLKTGEVEFKCFLENDLKEEPFRKAFRYENFAWFIPWELDEIMCIDLETLQFEYFSIPFIKKNKEKLGNYSPTYPEYNYFTAVRVDDERIFLVPTDVDVPLLINMKTKEMQEFPGIINLDKEKMWGAAVANDYIYISPYKGNRMLALNYKTGEIMEYPWKYAEGQFCGMTFYDDKLWFAPNTSNFFLSFNIGDGSFQEIPMSEFYRSDSTYHELVVENEKLWLVPWRSDYLLIYDPKTKSWSEKQKEKDICWSYKTEFQQIEYKGKTAFVTCRTGYILVYDRENDKFDKYPVIADRKKLSNVMRDDIGLLIKKMDSIYNEGIIDLEMFIKECVLQNK